MRGAIEYGQPLCGLSRVKSTRQKQAPPGGTCGSIGSLRGFRRANPVQPCPTPSEPLMLLCFPYVLLYFADLDASCRLRLPMQPLLASFLLLMPPLIADSSAFLLLMTLLIADSNAFLLLTLPPIADPCSLSLANLHLCADTRIQRNSTLKRKKG